MRNNEELTNYCQCGNILNSNAIICDDCKLELENKKLNPYKELDYE